MQWVLSLLGLGDEDAEQKLVKTNPSNSTMSEGRNKATSQVSTPVVNNLKLSSPQPVGSTSSRVGFHDDDSDDDFSPRPGRHNIPTPPSKGKSRHSLDDDDDTD